MKHTQSPKRLIITTAMSVNYGSRHLTLTLTYAERRDFFRVVKSILEDAYNEDDCRSVRWSHPRELNAHDIEYLTHHLNEIREMVRECETAYTFDFTIQNHAYPSYPSGYTLVSIYEPEGTLCSAVEGMDEILDEVEEDEYQSDSDEDAPPHTAITG